MRALLSLTLFATAAVGQAYWLQQSPSTSPGPRVNHNLVYEPATQRTFLFWGNNSVVGPFWMWNGADWTPTTSTFSGPILTVGLGGMCAEGAGAMLLFGGYRPGLGIGGGTPSVLDETWRVTATGAGVLQWTLLAPTSRPPARQGLKLVRNNLGLLMFGGTNVNRIGFWNDTWLWNGTTWANLAPPIAPSPRADHAMAFDSARNVVVVFGGAIGSSATSSDTWEFDGTTWQQRFPAHSPPARCRAACEYSPALGRTVLFGGGAPDGTGNRDDLWLWNGTDWHEVPVAGAAPGARQGAAFAYDEVRQQLLLFGGPGPATYYLDVQATTPTFTSFGSGCLGPTGLVPLLAPSPGEVPALGTTSNLRVTNLPLGLVVPVFFFGTSNTYEPNPGHPLPLDLGFLGWPGCQQLVSHDVFDAIPTLTGTATRALTVPFAAALVGFTIHSQVLVLYQPSGAATSNALTAVLGF